MNTRELEEILNRHLAVLRGMLINMRQLQRFLIAKDFDACAQITTAIENKRQEIEQLERRRLALLRDYPLVPATRPENIKGEEVIACFPVGDRQKIRLLLSQIRDATVNIQLLSQSVSRFCGAMGEATKVAFEELASVKEYTYTKDGEQRSRAQCAVLYDGTQ